MSHEKLNLMQSNSSVFETLSDEKVFRDENGKKRFTTGVYYVDNAIGGIYPNDVLVIGAKAGKGKTEFVVTIAEKNARAGNRVVYFALEAEPLEITRRIKYRYVSQYFFANRNEFQSIKYLRYLDWYYSNYGNQLARAEQYADEEISKFGKNLRVIYRDTSKYTVQDFARMFYSLQSEADIFIIDHIHYFDSDEPNENKALKEIMMTLRDCALLGNRAMVLVAHMRKSDRGSKQLLPDLEDFHGSSDIGKIATKAITLAPAKGFPSNGTVFPTYLKILKSRVGSDVENYTAICNYDVSRNTYEENYVIGSTSYDTFEECDPEFVPQWAQIVRIKNEFGQIVGVKK